MGIEQKILEIIEGVVAGSETQTEAAQKLGVGQVTLYGWLHPRSANTKNKTLYDALDKVGAKLVMPDEKLAEYVFIPKFTAKAGAGGSLETSSETEGFYAFRKEWVQEMGVHAQTSGLLTVVGDSMEPLLREGDTILVDKADTEIMDGKIYVVTLGDELKVKRIQKSVSGLLLCSENPRYDAIPVKGPDLEAFRVHGRVRWVGKEL